MAEMLVSGQQVTINVRKEEFELVVSTMPVTSGVKDKAVENIVPIVINGTPEEFDEGFIDALKNGLPEVTGLVANIKEFEESIETARKATEMVKKEKDEKARLKKEFDGYVELARINLREDKFLDAKRCLDKAAAVKDADKALVDKARKAVDERSGAGNMFGGPVDKSDGKNITLNKDLSVPKKNDATKTEEAKPANDAFQQAIELDENDNDDENENQEEE